MHLNSKEMLTPVLAFNIVLKKAIICGYYFAMADIYDHRGLEKKNGKIFGKRRYLS